MPLPSINTSIIKIIICIFPGNEKLFYTFDINKSFGDLTNELQEKQIIYKGKYYIEMNDQIMSDDMVLKDSEVKNDSCINFVRNNYIKIKVKVKDQEDEYRIIQKYVLISDFKVVKANENRMILNEEIKYAIDLLKDESSDHLSILEDLNILYDKIYEGLYNVGGMFLDMGFFSSSIKIFENEKEGDEEIISLLVIIINKIFDHDFKKEEKDSYKSIHAIDPLLYIMLGYYKEENYLKNDRNYDNKTREDAVKAITIIAKKYPSDVINNNNIKRSYEYCLPSNIYNIDEQKGYIYILFKEMIKEGIIKKGEEGTEIIEEILFIAKMINKKKDIINMKEEELIKEINDLIIIAKEKGFEEKLWRNRNEIIGEDIYIDWRELFATSDCCSYYNAEELKEEEKKIKKFCDYVISHSFDIQMNFINRLYIVNTRKNGLFLYLYLTFLFKIYHFEDILPEFFWKLRDKSEYIPLCYEYIIKLYYEIIERMMKEEKDIKINEENIIIIIFLWSVRIEKGKKEKEIKYLIKSTLKIIEWLGRVEIEKEEEVKEKEKELIKNEDKNKDVRENINRKEIIINYLVGISFDCSYEDKEKIIEDGRMFTLLSEIVKNHIKKERSLIQKGNKKKIIEYFIYSYNKDYDTSNLFSLPSPSFPFSHDTIVYILYNINIFFVEDCNNELMRKNIFIEIIELLNNYIDIIRIIGECDIKKEIEREIIIKWNNNIINKIYNKISFKWYYIFNILSSYLPSLDLTSFDNENNNEIKRIINLYYSHSNNNEKEKEMNKNEIKKEKFVIPFITNEKDRRNIVTCFISHFDNYNYYSMFNVFYLINTSENGCNILSILMKALNGEIIDRIKRNEGNNNVIIERRRYERERIYDVYYYVLDLLRDLMEYTFKDRNNIYLGYCRNKEEYKGREKEIKEDKDYISDVIEEEDMRECLILYLKHIEEDYCYYNILSKLSKYSNDALYYLLSINELLNIH